MDWKEDQQLSEGLPSRSDKHRSKSNLFKKKKSDSITETVTIAETEMFPASTPEFGKEPPLNVLIDGIGHPVPQESDEFDREGLPDYFGSYGKKKKRKKKMFPFRTKFRSKLFLAVLAGSIIVNVGAGAAVYKLVKDRKARFASQTAVATTTQPEAEKSAIRQVVSWTDEQKSILSKEERLLIEERLSHAVDADHFSNANFDFIFVPDVNQFSIRHDGALTVSAFLHNGYTKTYKTKKLNITCYYDGNILMSGIQNLNVSTSTAKSTYLLQMTFSPDDIRDPHVLDKLMSSKSELEKLKFEVTMSYEDGDSNLKNPPELWGPVKPHIVPARKQENKAQSEQQPAAQTQQQTSSNM